MTTIKNEEKRIQKLFEEYVKEHNMAEYHIDEIDYLYCKLKSAEDDVLGHIVSVDWYYIDHLYKRIISEELWGREFIVHQKIEQIADIKEDMAGLILNEDIALQDKERRFEDLKNTIKIYERVIKEQSQKIKDLNNKKEML